MKYLFFLLSLFLFTSCVTKKTCQQKFPPQIITKDSLVIKDTTIYVDIPIVIPGDSILLIDTIPCPINYEKEVIEDNKTISVKIKDGKLTAKCSTDSLVKVIQDLEVKVQNKEKYSSNTELVPVEVVKHKTPKWCWYYIIISLSVFAIIFRVPILSIIKKII